MTDELSLQTRLFRCVVIAAGLLALVMVGAQLKLEAAHQYRMFTRGPLRCLTGEAWRCSQE